MRILTVLLLLYPLSVVAQLDTTLVELSPVSYCGNGLTGLTAEEWEGLRPRTLAEVKEIEAAALRDSGSDQALVRLVSAYSGIRRRVARGSEGFRHVNALLDSLARVEPRGPESSEALAGVLLAQVMTAYSERRNPDTLRLIEQSRAQGFAEPEQISFDYLIALMALRELGDLPRRPRAVWGAEYYGLVWLAIEHLRRVQGESAERAVAVLDRFGRFVPTEHELASISVNPGDPVPVRALGREWTTVAFSRSTDE